MSGHTTAVFWGVHGGVPKRVSHLLARNNLPWLQVPACADGIEVDLGEEPGELGAAR